MTNTESQLSLAQRLVTALFAFVLVVGLMPISAWAEDAEAQNSESQEQQSDQGNSEKGLDEAGNSAKSESNAADDSSKNDASEAGSNGDASDNAASSEDEESASNTNSDAGVENDSSAQNSAEEESGTTDEQGADDVNQNNAIVLAANSGDAKPYYTYSKQMSMQDIYDRLDTYYSVGITPVHVYYAGEEVCTLSYLHDMSKDFPIREYGSCVYNCDWTVSEIKGDIVLQENVDVDSPENPDSYATYDGKDHKWVPTVTASVNPNFSEDNYTVSYYRGDNETSDFKSAGTITVKIKGIANYAYINETRTYTIKQAETLSVTAQDQVYTYNGELHGDAAEVSDSDGTTVEYSTDGNEWSTNAPQIKDVSELTVQVRATNPNYSNTATASYSLKVKPAELKVSVKGNSKTKTYNGEEESVEGFEVTDIEGDAKDLYSKDKVVLKDGVTAYAAGTNVGTYKIGLTEDSFANPDANFDVSYTVTDGELTINPAELAVSVKGTSETKVYNGGEQSIEGFEVTDVDGDAKDLFNNENVVLAEGVVAEAKGTNADTYMMGLTEDSFVNKDANFNVSFTVTDGELTIDKRAIEVSDSATLVYNGKEQVLNINAANVTGLVDGDTLNLFAQVKGTEPGVYNEVSLDSWLVFNDELNVTNNYSITVFGELTITEQADSDSDKADDSEESSDSETPETGDFTLFAMGSSLVIALAAFGALFASRKFRSSVRR